MTSAPFADFAPPVREQSSLRRAITAAYRRDEAQCLAPLLDAASLPPPMREAVRETARQLVQNLRAHRHGNGVEALVQEYSLSSQEGVALMCLAEALLRIPDDDTRDALIRDKISHGDWSGHIGGGRSLFVNAATWGLVVTGKLMSSVDDTGLRAALTRLVARAGEPVVRRAVDLAMRMMGEQFVTGESIEDALRRSKAMEAKGFVYSYDMLGEAAATAADAARYYRLYEQAIHAIGQAAEGRGIHRGPGISIKLSALHPRYARSQSDRVMGKLLPRVRALAMLCRRYDIGFNIDAEEADRLELSLDLLESLALDPELSGWDGLGFVVQAYGKRCPFVIDWIVDLAERSGRRIMVRLVKGAYWDTEIKRAQVDGLADFPVYTRKVHTDVAYIACARKLLAAADRVFPQFATHNAQTLATIHHLAGPDFSIGQYEFQCLHGMGEALYEQVVGKGGLDRPCRIYAPVGTHETLLPYLVRRLLENGANSSFVHRVADSTVPLEELIADPCEVVRAMPHPGERHEKIALPSDLYPDRPNSTGIDLSDEGALSELAVALRESAAMQWTAIPADGQGQPRAILNPADHRDQVGIVTEMEVEHVHAAVARATQSDWVNRPVADRAAILESAANAMQQRMPVLLGLIAREAGKSIPNAISEVREAIDFLRYYALQAKQTFRPDQQPLGPIACISPWNFPLAIFTGQVAAGLVAGNPVIAKPAEETPLIAAEAVRILHESGVPTDALQLITGDGAIGAALASNAQISGVLFTGSTEVARKIQQQLASRLSPYGAPIPLVAETGGQNAMIVDSSALPEQVVADVIASAFDSAGQRCSALRILCLQEDVADAILTMLKGALRELRIGRTDRLAIDIGPVITPEAKDRINAHIIAMRSQNRPIDQLELPPETDHGTFIAPTIIGINDLSDVEQEVFGPVLHVLRFPRNKLDSLIDSINATGYGLTFGIHTRLDETVAHVTSRVKAGNIYINRNMIGAVVGVQPFGGRGLSGTGPKAGGPLYLTRLVTTPPKALPTSRHIPSVLRDFAAWLEEQGEGDMASAAISCGQNSSLGVERILPGPVGQRDLYALHPRGRILLHASTRRALWGQMAAVLATGNVGVLADHPIPPHLPPTVAACFSTDMSQPCAAALVEGDRKRVEDVAKTLSEMPGPIMPLHVFGPEHCFGDLDYLLEEVAISINTTASGGNANLMMLD